MCQNPTSIFYVPLQDTNLQLTQEKYTIPDCRPYELTGVYLTVDPQACETNWELGADDKQVLYWPPWRASMSMSEVSLSLPAENSTGKCVCNGRIPFLVSCFSRMGWLDYFFVIRKARKILYGNFTLTFLCFRPCSSSHFCVKEQCVCYESKTWD